MLCKEPLKFAVNMLEFGRIEMVSSTQGSFYFLVYFFCSVVMCSQCFIYAIVLKFRAHVSVLVLLEPF